MLPLGPTCLVLELVTGDNSLSASRTICSNFGSAVCNVCEMHIIALLPRHTLGSTDDHTDQLARFAFDLVYTSNMVQAIYQALQSSASLGSCFWINPSGMGCCAAMHAGHSRHKQSESCTARVYGSRVNSLRYNRKRHADMCFTTKIEGAANSRFLKL